MAIAAVPCFFALAYVTRQIGPASIPIWFAAAGSVAWIMRGPIGQAIARAIDGGGSEGPAEIPTEVYAELDEMRMRLGELEERMDFSERLLIKKDDAQS